MCKTASTLHVSAGPKFWGLIQDAGWAAAVVNKLHLNKHWTSLLAHTCLLTESSAVCLRLLLGSVPVQTQQSHWGGRWWKRNSWIQNREGYEAWQSARVLQLCLSQPTHTAWRWKLQLPWQASLSAGLKRMLKLPKMNPMRLNTQGMWLLLTCGTGLMYDWRTVCCKVLFITGIASQLKPAFFPSALMHFIIKLSKFFQAEVSNISQPVWF